MHELYALLTPQTIVVADAGYSSVWITNCLTVRRAGQRLLTPLGLAGLGWGLPYATCAKLAAPSCSVVCVASDGGFAHTLAEIETMKRLGLPIVVIVLNNHILGYQKHANSVLLGGWTDTCHFVAVDHAALAGGQSVVRDVITDPEAYPPITAFQGRLPSPYRAAALLLASLVVLDRLLDVRVLPVW
jgi:acetolactate synthase I/II/III large subunit